MKSLTISFYSQSQWEELNKTKVVFQCYDCELQPTLTTADRSEAIKYCKANNCNYSEYPIGTYSHII